MIEFKRRVICDKCGKNIADLFGGYKTIKLSGMLYDLCSECFAKHECKVKRFEQSEINYSFIFKEGREE